ncbi:alpha-ketoglutarate permease domain protein [Cutibacterium avidum]|nr:MFS transporter [Cutibacterium avidum]KXA68036.1 alpha-ketoglutarate permease domain protein [Cutibacterium avidum]MCO6631949.1 MFS transporter [Cutibacterium avidum]MCO6664256.1 MFS transporter [Cutibacterium avidum]MCO6678944.1 MFS transporter [Cutibacterium avidum]
MSDEAITATAVNNSTHPAKNQSVVKTLAGTGIGNALEWYDWNVYAIFAVFISTQFFDSSDKTPAFLSTMAIFAVGFVARPVGGAFFGWLADKIGRKHSLAFAVIFASVGSLIIALSPTYNQIGAWASVLLVVARLIQGLAHGGELPAAQTYLSEMAPDERRGLWASAIYITGTVGMILGLLLGVILRDTLSDHALETWGWRIPFALGAVLGLVALWIRSSMRETEVFDQNEEIAEHHLWRGVLQNWRTGIKVIDMTCGLTVSYYIWSVSTAAVAEKNLGYSLRCLSHRQHRLLSVPAPVGHLLRQVRTQDQHAHRPHRRGRPLRAAQRVRARRQRDVASDPGHLHPARVARRLSGHRSGRLCRALPDQAARHGFRYPVRHCHRGVRRYRSLHHVGLGQDSEQVRHLRHYPVGDLGPDSAHPARDEGQEPAPPRARLISRRNGRRHTHSGFPGRVRPVGRMRESSRHHLPCPP